MNSIIEKEYTVGDSVYKAQFEGVETHVGKSYHKIKGTEAFVRKADECEIVHTVPQFLAYQQRACF